MPAAGQRWWRPGVLVLDEVEAALDSELERLLEAKPETLEAIPELGPIIAESVSAYLSDPENRAEIDLLIPDQAQIPARSHVTNDGCGKPRFVRE